VHLRNNFLLLLPMWCGSVLLADEQLTLLRRGHLEVAVLAGSALATKAGPRTIHNHLEIGAGIANGWSTFMGLTRIPEFAAQFPEGKGSRQFEIFQTGVQREFAFTQLPFKLNLWPYALAGAAFHSSKYTRGTKPPERFPLQFAIPVGGGVRILHNNRSRWGLRLEYRLITPVRPTTDFGVHHILSAGISIQLNP